MADPSQRSVKHEVTEFIWGLNRLQKTHRPNLYPERNETTLSRFIVESPSGLRTEGRIDQLDRKRLLVGEALGA